jgi:hypothetical protein
MNEYTSGECWASVVAHQLQHHILSTALPLDQRCIPLPSCSAEFWNHNQTTASVQLALRSRFDSRPFSSSGDAFRFPICCNWILKMSDGLMASTKLDTTQHTAQCKVICQSASQDVSNTKTLSIRLSSIYHHNHRSIFFLQHRPC